MTYIYTYLLCSAPLVMNWGYLENWKSTAPAA